jgi:hypothetical protein
MKLVDLIFGMLLCGLAVATQGCMGRGVELGGKLWATEVDERQESQATHRRTAPLKCFLWSDCSQSSEVPK